MLKTSILSAALLLAVVVVIAGPAAAATVSPPGVRFAQLAVGPGGATVVAWERSSKGAFAVEARIGRSPRSLGRTRRLSAKGYYPRVAVGTDGTAAVQWFELGRRGVRSLRVAVARPGHGFGRAQLVDRLRANIDPVGVQVQPNGRVVAVWKRAGAKLGFATAARGRAFGAPRNLATIGPGSGASMALDPRDGAVVVAYGTPLVATPPANQQAAARTLSPTAAGFSAPLVLSARAGAGSSLDEARPVAVSGPGGAAVAYAQVGGQHTLNLARRAADGSWDASERVALADYGQDAFALGLQAALLADGSALAAWSIVTYPPGGLAPASSSRVVASIAAPGAAFGPAQPLTPDGIVFRPAVVAAAGDDAFMATARPRGPVLLATRSSGAGAFGAPRTLTRAGDGDVLLAAAGRHVLAAYQRNDRLHMAVVR